MTERRSLPRRVVGRESAETPCVRMERAPSFFIAARRIKHNLTNNLVI